MAEPFYCQIRVKGHLPEPWSDWFGGLCVCEQPGDETLLCGELPDPSALYGVMDRMRDLGVALVAVHCETRDEG